MTETLLFIISALSFILAGVLDSGIYDSKKRLDASSFLSGYVFLVFPETFLTGIKWYWMALINIPTFFILRILVVKVFNLRNKNIYPTLNTLFATIGFILMTIGIAINKEYSVNATSISVFGWIFITTTAIAFIASLSFFINYMINGDEIDPFRQHSKDFKLYLYGLVIVMWVWIFYSAFYSIDSNKTYSFISGLWHGLCYAPNLLRGWLWGDWVIPKAVNYNAHFLYNVLYIIGVPSSGFIYFVGSFGSLLVAIATIIRPNTLLLGVRSVYQVKQKVAKECKEEKEERERKEKEEEREKARKARIVPGNGVENGHTYIDLGLSVKWADCNLGASSPNEKGDLFAWGEIKTKDAFTEENYKYFSNGEYEEIGNSLGSNQSEITSTQYDVAHVVWGGEWRLPTSTEAKELIEKCKWEWSSINGKVGFKVSGVNGNSIFIPLRRFNNQHIVGELFVTAIWTGTSFYDNSAVAADFRYNTKFNYISNSTHVHHEKYYGNFIRAVIEK